MEKILQGFEITELEERIEFGFCCGGGNDDGGGNGGGNGGGETCQVQDPGGEPVPQPDLEDCI